MKKLFLLSLLLITSACSVTNKSGVTTQHMEYQKSPCACLDKPIIFNGKSYTGENV